MGWLRRIFSRRRAFAELSEEMRGHLDERVEELVAVGIERREAEYRARREFGNFGLIEDDGRSAFGGRWFDDFVADVRYGLRMLRKSPISTAIAIVILAVGIGSNTAVFSLIDTLLLRNLAVPAPHELVSISFRQAGHVGPLSGPMFDRLRERQSAFRDLFAWTNQPMVLSEGGYAQAIQGAYATGSAFPTLGLRPRLGRLLEWEDDEAGNTSQGFAAVISEAFWMEHFGGATNVLGRAVVVNGMAATIVGVIPRSFNGMTVDYAPQIVLPFSFDVALHGKESGRFDPASRWFFTTGRLRDGVGFREAGANVATVAQDVLREAFPQSFRDDDALRDIGLTLSPEPAGISPLGEIYGRSLWTLQGLVALLLVICCANLASLQIARSLQREQEFAVRSALGAGRVRLVRQLAVESGLVAIAGASGGLLLSQWMSSLLVRYVEQSDFIVSLDLRADVRVLAWSIGITSLVAILAGVLPALGLTRIEAEAALRAGGRQLNVGRDTSRWSRRLLPVQLALSLLLVTVASLFAASARNLLHADLGFRVQGVTMFSLNFERRPEKGEALRGLYRRMIETLRRSPGVEAASVLAVRPLSESGTDFAAAPVEGGSSDNKHLLENVVGADYFATTGTRLFAGREFRESDRADSIHVCVVNEAASNYFFGTSDAVGKHIRAIERGETQGACEIVGVVADTKYSSVRQQAPPTIYYAFEQMPAEPGLSIITRSSTTASAVTAFQDSLRKMAPDTPLLPAVTMERQLEDSIGQERLLASVSLFFGLVALAMTSIGLYGVQMQRVTQRTPEIGLRMALGAQPRDMLWSVTREIGLFLAVGLPMGLVLAIACARFVEGFLYEVSATNPGVYFGATAATLLVAIAASWLPARRATRVDPMVALRHE
jgi:predicted permease